MNIFLKLLTILAAFLFMPIAFACIFACGLSLGWNDGFLPIFQHFGITLPYISYGWWVFAWLIFGLMKIPFVKVKPAEDQLQAWAAIFTKVGAMYAMMLLVLIVKAIIV